MLLNLSNHPTTKWLPEQIAAAQQTYGTIQDIPFPNINPSWTTEEVQVLAEKYKKKCLEEAKTAKVVNFVVHVMGEMTFTFAFVRLLQKEGITCVASTTERSVIENEDGSKTFLFKFVKFRLYSLL